MTDREYISRKISHIESLATQKFSVDLKVASLLFDDIQTGGDSYATIFEADDEEVYVLHEDSAPLTLLDVNSRMRSLGIEVAGILPPYGDKDYFDRQGKEAFMRTYPGRTVPTDQERSYYANQSPYNPALILVGSVPGELKRFNAEIGQWRADEVFTYQRQGTK